VGIINIAPVFIDFPTTGKHAEKLLQMNEVQLLIVKTYQDGLEMGQRIERERLNADQMKAR